MSRSQLETDLLNNAHERLVQWRQDTIMRCEAVEINYKVQITMIYTSLVAELVNLAYILKMSEADFAILMQHAHHKYRTVMDAKNNGADVEKAT